MWTNSGDGWAVSTVDRTTGQGDPGSDEVVVNMGIVWRSVISL